MVFSPRKESSLNVPEKLLDFRQAERQYNDYASQNLFFTQELARQNVNLYQKEHDEYRTITPSY
jgi:hypothetical protein